ncbi:FAD-dependent monooxygenase, partial [uncultured Pigmentiphaga sp.]|uniref:FAD-dependent monooxygenase n=1 Tax=uncultured Pigmentiphaga sp. TaxID=340361 RepID=UPI00262F8492
MKIVIAGAGLGGLVAAASLMKEGFDVEVYEQAETLGEVGAGIQVSPSAVKVLFRLGLREELEKIAVRPKAMHFRRFDTGELMATLPLIDHEANFGAPYYHLHRADLHEIILRKVQELNPRCVRTSARAVGFEEHASSVTLLLADGSRASGDLLIGADGIKSVVRNQVLGPSPVTYTGDISWRAVVPVERLPKDLMERV